MQNLELKAYYPDHVKAREIAFMLGAREEWTRVQTDTYFSVRIGKLKIRQCQDEPAELIFYDRPETPEEKISNYLIYSTLDGNYLLTLLKSALSVRIVVQKIRTLFLCENIRIHLDDVKNLGKFIEFEGVISPGHNLEVTEQRLSYLKNKFAIKSHDLLSEGYFEMLNKAKKTGLPQI